MCAGYSTTRRFVSAILISKLNMSTQLTLDGDTIPQRFEKWKVSKGGNFCLWLLYRITANYYATWLKTGNKPSTRLVWEQLRYRLNEVRARAQAKGVRLRRDNGYWLNDHFTQLAKLHMLAEHPEWEALFETRDAVPRFVERTIIVKERIAKAA